MGNKNIINKVIRTLVLSDFFLFFSVGLLSPIFAVFVLENIDNRIEVIGYAIACYWVARVIFVIPTSYLMDKLKGEVDEYFFMVVGSFMISAIPLFYIFSSEPWHIYLLQAINGFANSLAVPAWRIIFTKHVDRNIVGFEWSLEDVGVGISTAASAALGAIIAGRFGFNALFIFIFLVGSVGAFILLGLLNREKKKALREMLFSKIEKAPLKIDTIK